MKKLILAIVVASGVSAFAQVDDGTTTQKEIINGYYDSAEKKLIVSGPAAEALWNQMVAVDTEKSLNGSEPVGVVRESGGTHCERSLQRPRPMARSVPVFVCEISQAAVGL